MTVGRTAGLIGALMLALSPFGIEYSQEARMYSLLALAATLYAATCFHYCGHHRFCVAPGYPSRGWRWCTPTLTAHSIGLRLRSLSLRFFYVLLCRHHERQCLFGLHRILSSLRASRRGR